MKKRANGDGSVHKRKENQWAAYLTLPNGKRRYFYGRTKREALEKFRVAKIKLDRGQTINDDRRTVGEYLTWWLKDQKQHLAQETWRGYESKVRNHLIPAFDKTRLARLSPIQVREFVADKMKSDLSSRHVNNIFDILHAALEDARKMELVDRNVASLVDTPKVIPGKRTALTEAQALRLLDVVEDDPLGAMFRLSLTLGLRPGEVLGLQWQNVDLDAGTIQICTTLQRHDGKWVLKPTPKTDKSEQTLPLPPSCVAALRKRRAEQNANRSTSCGYWEEWGLVFTRRNGVPVWFSDANRHLAKMCIRAGVPKVTMHELRHSAPSILLSLGVDQRVIMRVLRHSTIVLTANLYTHVVDPLVAEAVGRIDRAFAAVSESEIFTVGVPVGVQPPEPATDEVGRSGAQSSDQDI
jgi:integrase